MKGGGKWGRGGGKWGERGSEVGIGYPPVHPLLNVTVESPCHKGYNGGGIKLSTIW